MKKMHLLGYNVTIEKRPKITAESIFSDIEYQLRDVYEKDYWEYYTVPKSMYRTIQELAKEDYYACSEEERPSSISEETSYYRFELVEKHWLGKVTFRVATR